MRLSDKETAGLMYGVPPEGFAWIEETRANNYPDVAVYRVILRRLSDDAFFMTWSERPIRNYGFFAAEPAVLAQVKPVTYTVYEPIPAKIQIPGAPWHAWNDHTITPTKEAK